ncbi:MAG: hypothetical protein JWP75_1078 [Frondihabitans sp.]|nr:hypothetical protein [Frondihabitans sp.]
MTVMSYNSTDGTRSHRREPEPLDTSALLFSWVALFCGLGVAGAAAFHVAPLQAVCAPLFLIVGLGSPPVAFRRNVGWLERVAATGLFGLSASLLIATACLVADVWRPSVLTGIAVVLVVPTHLFVVWRGRALGRVLAEDVLGAARRAASRTVLTALLGVALCAVAAVTHRHVDPGFYGFLRHVGPLWYFGLVLILVALLTAPVGTDRQLALVVLCLMLVLTGTPAIVYDAARSASTAKHVELVQQIRLTWHISSSVPVYNGWPGFFSGAAWLCDLGGIRDPFSLARVWPVALGVLRVIGLHFLIRQVVRDPRAAWWATAVAVLADPLGADYFSPQSVGFVLGLLVFGFALQMDLGRTRVALVLAGGTAAAVSHQLSPYVISGVLLLLAAMNQIRPRWLPLCALIPTVGWTLWHRSSLKGFISLSGIGNPQNFAPPKTTPAPGLGRLAVVSHSVEALLLCVAIAACLALIGLLRGRGSLRTWGAAASPAVGLAFVAINPYGQEGIFRAVLFGLPWLAVLAGLYFQTLRKRIYLLSPVFAMLTVSFLVSAFALDPIYVIRNGDITAFQIFRASTGTSADSGQYLLNMGEGDLPSSPPGQGGTHLTVLRTDLQKPVVQIQRFDGGEQVMDLTTAYVKYAKVAAGSPTLYALWSPVSAAYDEAYGLQTVTQFTQLRDSFRASPYWSVTYTNGQTYLFRLDLARYQATARR